jgi:DNA-binding NtrC family response regulator/tetratricopeptide (TPR) repeat protein
MAVTLPPPRAERSASTRSPYHALDVQALARVHEELADGGVLWVIGSRGMSKAALLSELRRELSARGRLVLFGRGEKTVDAPYGALTEPLSQALQFLEARGTAEAFMDRHASALAVILPSLLSPAPRAPDKLAFLEALRALFFELSKEAPLSLLLADVHYVDDDTRDALRFLARHLFDPDVGAGDEDRGDGVLVMACRTDDEDGQALVGSVGTGPRTRTFVVESFGRERLWQYLEHHPLLDRLLLASQGRPEDVDELLESLPRSTDDLLMRRIEGLDDTSQRLVRALAIIGRPAPADLLGSVAQASHMEVSQRLGPLVEARLLVRRLHNGELLFSFARPHHQEALLKHMAALQRLQLHGAIAAALEQRAARDDRDDNASAQLLGHHFLQSNEPQRGVPYALAACESLLVTFAYGVVSRLAKQALVHAQGEHRFALLGHLVEAERRRGESATALQQAQQLRALATAEQLPSVLRRVGELLAERGECDEALFVLEEALALVVDSAIDDALPPRAEIRAAMAEVAFKKNDFTRAVEEARGALVQAQQAPAAFSLRVSNTLGKVDLAQDRISAAHQRFLDNLRVAEQHGLDVEARLAKHNAGICQLRLGKLDEAQTLFEQVLQSARAMGDLLAEAQALQNLGALWQKGGNVGRALDAYRAALSRLVRVGNQAEVRRTTWNVSNLLCGLGHYDDAKAALEQARKGAERDASARALSFVSSTEGDMALFQQRFTDALVAYQRTRVLREEVGEPSLLHEATLRVGMTALMLQDVEQASGILQSLLGADLQVPARLRRDVFAAAVATFQEGNGHAALVRMAAAAAELTRQQAPDDAWRMHAWVALRAEQLNVAGVAHEARANAVGLIERSLQALPPAMAAVTRADPLRARLLRGEPMHKVAVVEPIVVPMVAAEPLARRPEWDQVYAELIGESPALMRVLDRLDRLRRTRLSTVLIRGESGTGKELVASAIHQTSERAAGPFIRVNCAALVETLLMSELFGHEKGSFTGALARKIGRFELARGGTLFLDEIGDISAKTQVSLLRVLQEKQFERVGGTTTITTDAVVICATHRDLEDMVRQHAFREDLYYRLKGVVVDVPPLRERLGDLAMLAKRFLLKAKTELGRAPDVVSEEALAVLTRHRWPGNIRELQNVIRSVALFCEHPIVQLSDLAEFPELFGSVDAAVAPSPTWTPTAYVAPPPVVVVTPVAPRAAVATTTTSPVAPPVETPPPPDHALSLGDLKRKLEFEAIAAAIRQTGGNVTQAAALLKMKRPRLSQIINGNPELKAVKDGLRSDDDATEKASP